MYTTAQIQKIIADLQRKHQAQASLTIEPDPDRPGWAWLCWDNTRVKLLQLSLWDSL